MARWGKAGVRLTDGQAAAADRRAGALRALGRQQREENLRLAHRKWAAGMVVPAHITRALNLIAAEGPGVDAACLAAEPDVDMWEAGRLYPSWEQVVALARLCGVAPLYFTGPPKQPMNLAFSSLRIHRPDMFDGTDPPPVYEFTRAALDAAAPMGVRA